MNKGLSSPVISMIVRELRQMIFHDLNPAARTA